MWTHVDAEYMSCAIKNTWQSSYCSPRYVRPCEPSPCEPQLEGKEIEKMTVRGWGAREGRDERRVSQSETARRRDGRISECTRCPDLVYLWASSLDGIQLSLLRLSTRSSMPAPLINNGKFDDNKKKRERDNKGNRSTDFFPSRMEKRAIICRATTTIQSVCDLSPAAGKLCTVSVLVMIAVVQLGGSEAT